MLAVTNNAAMAIRDLTAQQEVPADGGLRIAADAPEGSLSLSLVTEPMEGDQMVDASGAHLYLDRIAAEMLADKELDVAVDESGAVQFALSEQSAGL
ncbi:MAG TPA: adhesin [Micromonosporaceae bacterium]